MEIRRGSWCGGALVAVLFLWLPVPASASARAALTGVEVVTAASRMDSDSGKGAQAFCPSGKQVIGAGGYITTNTAAQNRVIMNQVLPDAALTSVTTFAWEDETATKGNWMIRATAVCADAPSGIVRETRVSAYDSSRSKSQVVACAPHKWLLGAGALIEGAEGQVVLDRIELSTNRSATVGAIEDQTGTTENWLIRAYAICASAPPGQELVSRTSAASSADKGAGVNCPPGKQVTSAGGTIIGGNGEMALISFSPRISVPDLATVHAAEDHDGTAANWSVQVQAMCVNL